MPSLLLVDNDARITELTGWFLERRGHEVRTATSYAEARVTIAERAPDLLLADLELGEESGRVELARLAGAGLLPPTLVVSGYLDREIEAELMRLANVRGTLSKPFDLPDLERAIDGVLGSASPERTFEIPRPESPPSIAPVVEPAERRALETTASEPDDDGWVEIVPVREDHASEDRLS